MLKHSLHIVLLFFTLVSFGQSVELNSFVDTDRIEIGEPFIYTLQVKSGEKLESIEYTKKVDVYLGFEGSKDKFGQEISYEFEIIEEFKDTNYQLANEYYWEGKYTLTAWDSAYAVLPPDSIRIDNKTYSFPAQLMEIAFPIPDPNREFYDINETFTVVKKDGVLKLLRKISWLVLVLVALLYFIFKSRKKKDSVFEAVPITLEEKYLYKIDKLEQSRLFERDLKEYYFELSVILRKFLSEQYEKTLLHSTTNEVTSILQEQKLSKITVDQIALLLRQSDMVKFAKSKPTSEEIHKVTEVAREVVKEITRLEVGND